MCMDKGEQSENGWRRTDFLASPFTKSEPITFLLMGYVKEKYRVGQSSTSVDLICTNVCTCIYEYNITYAVTLVTLFAPTCFDHT